MIDGGQAIFHHMGLWCALFGKIVVESANIKKFAESSQKRREAMGNHMDKVMDGLYVGGFLGQLSPGSIKNSTHTKKSISCCRSQGEREAEGEQDHSYPISSRHG